jgi:hypothetical protein
MPRPEEAAAFTKDRLDEMSLALHHKLMRIYATKDRKKAKVFTKINSLAHPVATIHAWAG